MLRNMVMALLCVVGAANDASEGEPSPSLGPKAKSCNLGFDRPFDPYTTLGIERSAGEERIRAAYWALALRNHPNKLVIPTAEQMAIRYRLQRSYEILMSAVPGSRGAYDGGLFNSQLSYEAWKPTTARDPVNAINDGRSISEFWFDGPVQGLSASDAIALLQSPLKKPVVVFLYTNWCTHAIRTAVEFKEAAYTVDEHGYRTRHVAVDCDEPEAERLCSAEMTLTGDVPSIVIFHPAAGDEEVTAAAGEDEAAAGANEDASANSAALDGSEQGDGGAPPPLDNHDDAHAAAELAADHEQLPSDGDAGDSDAAATIEPAAPLDIASHALSIADLDLEFMRKATELTTWIKERVDEHRNRARSGTEETGEDGDDGGRGEGDDEEENQAGGDDDRWEDGAVGDESEYDRAAGEAEGQGFEDHAQQFHSNQEDDRDFDHATAGDHQIHEEDGVPGHSEPVHSEL